MVSRLCARYGAPLGSLSDTSDSKEELLFYDFPPPEALSGPDVEAQLREMGFGYRARYIAETARVVAQDKPAGWLTELRNPLSPALGGQQMDEAAAKGKKTKKAEDTSGYKTAHEELLTLSGVGPKVADCVCLMGLGWAEAVPVDTHVWQIAQRDYRFGSSGKTKTFNKAMYDAVGDHFRSIWGSHAGWAQSVLFTANLRSFADQAASGKARQVKSKDEEEVKVEVVVEEEELVSKSGRKIRKRKTTTVEVEVDVKSNAIDITTSVRTRSNKRQRFS
jgi:N-glycosylase/DNA lyase